MLERLKVLFKGKKTKEVAITEVKADSIKSMFHDDLIAYETKKMMEMKNLKEGNFITSVVNAKFKFKENSISFQTLIPNIVDNEVVTLNEMGDIAGDLYLTVDVHNDNGKSGELNFKFEDARIDLFDNTIKVHKSNLIRNKIK